MPLTKQKSSASGGQEKVADPPEYEPTSGTPQRAFTPKLVTSTYVADDIQAYVEIDSIAHGHWDAEPATLVTLVIAHVRPRTLSASTVSLTISATGRASFETQTNARPALLFHAPNYLRRPVAKGRQEDYMSLGVFAPAPQEGENQRVVIVLEDPLLVGLPDRVKVCLVIATHGRAFSIDGLIRPEAGVVEQRSNKDRIDRGTGALIEPGIGLAANTCTECIQPAPSSGESRCDALDAKHVPYERWLGMMVSGTDNLHKWRIKDQPAEGSWCNDRSASALSRIYL